VRDIVITLIILGLLTLVPKRPWVGVLMWIWVSVMTPQRFAFGFAYSLPFAALIAAVTLLSMVKSKDQVDLPINTITILFIVFPLWMCVTSVFALESNRVYDRWKTVMKIFFFLLVAASLIKTRKHVDWLIWVIVFSVGFFGVKGGIFTIMTGGGSKVWGPPGEGPYSDNNAISAALVMVIPLMFYLRSVAPSKWAKRGLLGAAGLSAMAILGSQSRGAFLAILTMLAFLWLKSKSKFGLAILLIALLPVAIGFMPDSWESRMRTIQTYEQDTSAMGRINAWVMAFNLANARPLVGGGFEVWTPNSFAKYAPDPTDVHAAHSNYFQILGEHGYIGLGIFLVILIVGWSWGGRIIKLSQRKPELAWAASLARAVQVSLIGYASAGAFINIGYWEIMYYEIIALMVVRNLLEPQNPKNGRLATAHVTQTAHG
jgi:putative inorganic carbon (HCO3(-)) transporter